MAFSVAWFETACVFVRVLDDLLRLQQDWPRCIRTVQLAHPTCGRSRVPSLSSPMSSSQPCSQTWLSASLSHRKSFCLWEELAGTVCWPQGIQEKSGADRHCLHSFYLEGQVVKASVTCLLSVHRAPKPLLMALPLAPTLILRLCLLWKTRIKGRILKSTVL